MKKKGSDSIAETPKIPLESVLFSFGVDTRKRITVYPAEWLIDPELRENVPKNNQYFLSHLKKPTEMTINEYLSRMAVRVSGQADLVRYYTRVEKLEKKYSKGDVMFT
jgi:hypothetical protein